MKILKTLGEWYDSLIRFIARKEAFGDEYTRGVSDGYKTGFEDCAKLQVDSLPEMRLQSLLQKNLLLKSLFVAVDAEEVFSSKDGVVYLNGKPLDPIRATNLGSEAKLFASTELWKVMTETLKYAAMESMYTKSKDYQDMIFGKAILYSIDILKKIRDAAEH